MNEMENFINAIAELTKHGIDMNPNFSEWENGGANLELKMESCLSKEEIEERFWEKGEEPAISLETWHPMETFLEQLR